MVRLLLSALFAAHLLWTAPTMARPVAVVVRATATELDKLAFADSPASSFSFAANEAGIGLASAPGSMWHQNRRRIDRSVTGAEVILGALAAAVIVAVICYIRVTRKRVEESKV